MRSDDSIKRIFGEHVAKEQETKMEFPTTFLTQFLILTKRMFIQNKRNAVSVNVRSERAPCFFSDRCSWHSKWLTSTLNYTPVLFSILVNILMNFLYVHSLVLIINFQNLTIFSNRFTSSARFHYLIVHRISNSPFI